MIVRCNFSSKCVTLIAFLVQSFPDLFELVIISTINLNQLSTQTKAVDIKNSNNKSMLNCEQFCSSYCIGLQILGLKNAFCMQQG